MIISAINVVDVQLLANDMKVLVVVLLLALGAECRKRNGRNEIVIATFPDKAEADNHEMPVEPLPDPETVIASIPKDKILNKPKHVVVNNSKSCPNCPKDASDYKSKSHKTAEGYEIVDDEPVEAEEVVVASEEFVPIKVQAEPAKMAESKPKVTRKAIERPNLNSENSAESVAFSVLGLFAIIIFICLQADF